MQQLNVTCRLNADDVSFLDQLTKQYDRDRSDLINQAVADYISLLKWQNKEIKQGLAEADAGEFASDQEVEDAFARWTTRN